jgi:hypothetical protein
MIRRGCYQVLNNAAIKHLHKISICNCPIKAHFDMVIDILPISPCKLWPRKSEIHKTTILETILESCDLILGAISRPNVFILTENLVKIPAANPRTTPGGTN